MSNLTIQKLKAQRHLTEYIMVKLTKISKLIQTSHTGNRRNEQHGIELHLKAGYDQHTNKRQMMQVLNTMRTLILEDMLLQTFA